MATDVYFNGRKESLPGVYSTIKSGINNPPQTSDYGKCLIIDTGGGASYGGGGGINGEHTKGSDAIYTFNTLQEFRTYQVGGLLWKTAEGLFKPDGSNVGISQLIYVRAATTVAASMSFTATGGGSAGGTFAFDVRDEGLIGNGSEYDGGGEDGGGSDGTTSGDLSDPILIKGYAYTVESGVIDTNKFIFKIWKGNYTGLRTSDKISFGEDTKLTSIPNLIAQSPEFNNIQDLINWADTDSTFNSYFVKGSCTVTGAGTVDSTDVTAVAGYNLASGGTETYGTTDLTDTLSAIKDLDYTFILSDKYGTTDYDSASVGAIQSHIETEAKYDKYMFYGGGKDSTEFSATDGSLDQAAYFDSNKVIVVHGDAKKASSISATGFRQWETIYKAARVLGRIAGQEPQVPGTFKSIGIEGEVHALTDIQREQALAGGVLTTYFDIDFNTFIITQSINTLQNNKNIVNADGKSFTIEIERIKAQLNKDLVINAKVQLLGQPSGVNRNTLSQKYVENWTKAFLQTKVATQANDNLLIGWQDVVATRQQDNYFVTYGITANTPVTKLFFTGSLLD